MCVICGMPPECCSSVGNGYSIRPSVDDGSSFRGGGKWGDPQNGTPGGVVTWSIGGPGIDVGALTFTQGSWTSRDPDAVFDFDHETWMRDVFAVWSEVANIEFVQVEDSGEAMGRGIAGDIRVFTSDYLDDGTLGVAFLPHGNGAFGGDLTVALFDGVNDIASGGMPEFFMETAIHEVGHAIGLGHIDDTRSIMYPTAQEERQTELHDIDVRAIRDLYGAQDFEDEYVKLMGATQFEFKLVHSPKPLTVIANAFDNEMGGSDGIEEYHGLGGDDRIETLGGDDVLLGDAGHDMLDGGAGSDMIVGGEGIDRALFDGASDGWSPGAAGAFHDGSGSLTLFWADGSVDSVFDVELLVFSDGVLALDLEGSELGFVFRHYRAAFGREADAGVLFWQNEMRHGLAREELAEAFVGSAEFARRYGEAPDAASYIDALYLNVFGREADEAGRDFWTGAFEAGVPRGAMLTHFAESGEARDLTGATLAEGLFFEGTLESFGIA